MLYHLVKRGRTYYYRLHIPKDLSHYFPIPEVRKSLKTSNLAAAKILYSSWVDKFQRCFALLRSGFATDEQVEAILGELLPTCTSSRLKAEQSLSELIELYIADRSAHWSAKTKVEFTRYFATLLSLITDKAANSISRSDCISCRDLLLSLPPNFTKKKQYKGMTAPQIAKANSCGQSLSAKTVNKYLTLLSSFFKWANQQELATSNPAEGLLLPLNKLASEEREIYSMGEINRIQAKLPRSHSEPEKYWVPIIAMYSGMRLDEICQLHKEDIQLTDVTWCFNLNSKGDKRLKTAISARLVPIHPKLVELGLMDYFESINNGSIWPNISPDKFGRWGHKLGNWYSRFNRREVTNNPKKCFHSFRHTVANQLKQKGISETVIAEILGHKNNNITTGRYGKNYDIKLLSEAIISIQM